MHFFEGIVDSHRGGCRIGMGSHNAHDTAHAGIQASRNDAQDNVFAGKDAGNPGMSARGAR